MKHVKEDISNIINKEKALHQFEHWHLIFFCTQILSNKNKVKYVSYLNNVIDLSGKGFFSHFCCRFLPGMSHELYWKPWCKVQEAPKLSHQTTRNKSSLLCPSKTPQSAIVFNTIWPHFMHVLGYWPNLVWLLFGVYPHSQSPQFETGKINGLQ